MRRRRSLYLVLALVALIVAVWSYMLIATPQVRSLNQQVNDVAEQLRCPVCQNESIADSSASIAEQMRLVIRQQLQSGQSEQQVLQYFAAHYGNQILLTPPRQGINLLAWLMPILAMLVGLGLITLLVRDWRAQNLLQLAQSSEQTDDDALTDPELEQYRVLLEKELEDEDDPLAYG
jgi:cytochrome c-type biogenesis protein CcmH